MSQVQITIVPTQPKRFQEATRIQHSFLTQAEKRVLRWLAERTPERVNSDHLTAMGAIGMFLAGVSYALTRYSHYGLLLSCVFLAVNWLGDSLDGTLARHRSRLRPRYGFYVDHVMDSFGVAALLAGMAASAHMQPLIAVGLLVAYLLLSSEIFLSTYTLARFEMSYLYLGPTELRILLCLGNLYVFLRPSTHPFGLPLSLFDWGGLIGSIGLLGLAIASTIRHGRLLYDAERL